MKRFEFRFEGLLRVRRVEERRRERDVQEKQREIRTERDELDRVHVSRNEHLEALRSVTAGPLPMQEIISHRRMLNGLAAQRGVLEERLRQLGREIVPLQRQLEVAIRERKAVERLRERRHEEYVQDHRREETAILDEIGQSSHQKREGSPA